jgi:DinB superfamily
MTPAESKWILDYLHETRQSLLRSTDWLSLDQLQFRPAPGRWSVAECMEHIVVVENRILDGIHDAIRQPIDPATRSAFDNREGSLRELVADRSVPREAPDPVRPLGRWPVHDLLAQFRLARARSVDCAQSQSELRQHFFSHRAFGVLDCYQWLLLIAAHGERHRQQAEEVIAAPGFPRAAAAV